jgi:translation initiation factor IF-3
VSDDGSMLGVFDSPQAVELARQKGLDLVEVSPDADPPVCKMLDFGRFKYSQKKREKESRKKSHANERKEIRFRPKTDTADLQRKLDHARELLEDGYRLQLTMRLRGREMAYKQQAAEMLVDAVQRLSDVSTLEGEGAEGRQLIAMLAPKKSSAKSKASGGAKKAENAESSEDIGTTEEQSADNTEPEQKEGNTE